MGKSIIDSPAGVFFAYPCGGMVAFLARNLEVSVQGAGINCLP